MNAADRRRLTPVAAIVAAILLALLITLWAGVGSGAHWRDAAASAELPQPEATAKPPDVAPLDQYREVWQHPLFSPTRSPEAARSGNESSGNLQLTGVIMQPGLKMAILHDNATGKDYRVIEGQPPRQGPALVALHPRSAVVEAAGTRLHLTLLPGPSGDSGVSDARPPAADEDAEPAPEHSAGEDTSAMVSRRGAGEPAASGLSGTGAASTEARARMLRARIEARRRQAQGSGG